MNIDELQAGPELDQLVAEKVLGWKRHEWPAPMPRARGDNVEYNVLYCAECGAPDRKGGAKWHTVFCDQLCQEVPKFSVDIAAAWAVLERVYEIKGVWICVEKNCIDGDFNAGVVGDIGDPDWWRWATNAQTAPLAICRAALKAVLGIDKSDQSVV